MQISENVWLKDGRESKLTKIINWLLRHKANYQKLMT